MTGHSLPVFILLLASRVAPAAEPLTFEQHVRPILKAYCLDCHGAEEKPKGKLDLRLRRLIVAGGRKGPSLVAGKPAESLLIERMKSGDMPPGEKKVPKEQIALVERWIAGGAVTRRDEPASLPPGIDITPEERAYWFFQPIRPQTPPLTHPAVRTPIDAFLLARLQAKKLTFNPDADRATLLRRLSLDLLGLPPTPAEIDAFVADARPDAYERIVERLLASPAYGERWGRHWLDVAGYADSEGDGTTDTPRPHAWKYRDWVVRALNADRPLDRFVTEQLAGDELVPRPWTNLRPEQIELLTATGFLRTAPDATASGGGQVEAEQVVTDTLKIVGSSLLGLTVGCAQCHDHRYDPIPQLDYFRLRAVFEPALDPLAWRRPTQRRVTLYTDADRAKAAAVEAEVAKLQAEVNLRQTKEVQAAFDAALAKFPAGQQAALRAAFETPEGKRTPEQKQLVATNPKLNISPGVLYQYNQAAADELKKLQDVVTARRAQKPVEDFVAVLDEVPGHLPATRLHHRGDYRQPKAEVAPGDLTIASPEGKRREIAVKDPTLPSSGRRLALARQLTSGEHPLLGRVLANRIWLHHFGRGLVDSPGDFGVLGQRPSHPELLDWLAGELVRSGWSLKQMHRLIVTSTAYRQTSRHTPAQDAVDTSNTLLARYPLRRLEAEAIRDRMLAASGRLDRRLGGAPVAGSEDAVGQVHAPDDQPRRSLYLQLRRTRPVAFLGAFDAPVSELNCDRRVSSTVAPQALMLMNSDFVLQQAGHLARRVVAEMPADFARDRLHSQIARFPRPADAWSYGFGEYDPTARRVTGFTPLGHWTGSAWQAGPVLPDPKHGFVMLQDGGGHAGNDQKHAAVRRWTAPRDGRVELTGKLIHPLAGGDGVRGRVVSSRGGLSGEWSVKNRAAATSVSLDVRAGDTLDLVLDCQANVTSDWFTWPVTLRLTASGGAAQTWTAVSDFQGPRPALAQLAAFAWQLAYQRFPGDDEIDLTGRFLQRQIATLSAAGKPDAETTALTNLCQQLLASSEFLYVD